jgi:hypothetical protein
VPFDAILVTAAPEQVPEALVRQLAIGGRMVIPLGAADGAQRLDVITRGRDGTTSETLFPVQFVPMTGGSADDSATQPLGPDPGSINGTRRPVIRPGVGRLEVCLLGPDGARVHEHVDRAAAASRIVGLIAVDSGGGAGFV